MCLKLFEHGLQLIHEGVDILEFAINGSEPDVSHFIQILQLVHHKLTDDAARNLLVLHAENLVLHFIDKIGQLRCTDGALMTGTKNACFNLFPVIGLTIIVLLDDDQRNRLDLLICGKSLSAFITFSSSPYGIVVFCGSGINYAGIFLITIGTLHFGSSLS